MTNTKVSRTFMMIAMFFLGSIVVSGAFWGGYVIQTRFFTRPQQPLVQPPKQISTFYVKEGKIYRVSSDTTGEQQLFDTVIAPPKAFLRQSPFALAGDDKDKLVYAVMQARKPVPLQNPYVYDTVELRVYNLQTQENLPLVKVDVGKESIGGFVVSPDGKRVAYTLDHVASGKNAQFSPLSSVDLMIVNLETGETKKLAQYPSKGQENLVGILVLEKWLDDETLAIGFGYEGIAYCSFKVTDTVIPNQCDNLGHSYMDSDTALFKRGGRLYGFVRPFNLAGEPGVSSVIQGIFYRTEGAAEKHFLNNSYVTEMTVSKEGIYYFVSQGGQSNVSQAVATDLFFTDFDGNTTQRLTGDGNSVRAKQHLSVSLDGRYVSYDSYLISAVDGTKPETIPPASSAWLYDTQLKKLFKVADGAVYPFVLVK